MPDTEHAHEHDQDEKKLEPRVAVEEVGPCKLKLRVEVDAAKVRERIDGKYRDLNEKMQIPGFRPGKTPRHLLERKYGKSILEDVKFELLHKSFEEAKESSKIEPLGDPDLAPEKIEVREGEPFVYEFTVEVRPRFELKAYAGVKVKKAPVRVADREIDEHLEGIRQERAEYHPTEEGALENDMIIADFDLMVDGGVVDHSENAEIHLAPDINFYGQELPDFYKTLAGRKAGEGAEFSITLAADFHVKTVAGKTAAIRAKIKSVKRRTLPALDADFAKGFDCDSVEELRGEVKKQLLKAKEKEARAKMGDEVIAAILKENDFKLPEGYLKDRAQAWEARVRSELVMRGVPEADADKKLQDEREKSRERVEQALKEELIVEHIAKKEKIFATEEEVDDRLFEYSSRMGKGLHEIRQMFEEQGTMPHIRRALRHEKVREFLLSKAVIE